MIDDRWTSLFCEVGQKTKFNGPKAKYLIIRNSPQSRKTRTGNNLDNLDVLYFIEF